MEIWWTFRKQKARTCEHQKDPTQMGIPSAQWSSLMEHSQRTLTRCNTILKTFCFPPMAPLSNRKRAHSSILQTNGTKPFSVDFIFFVHPDPSAILNTSGCDWDWNFPNVAHNKKRSNYFKCFRTSLPIDCCACTTKNNVPNYPRRETCSTYITQSYHGWWLVAVCFNVTSCHIPSPNKWGLS